MTAATRSPVFVVRSAATHRSTTTSDRIDGGAPLENEGSRMRYRGVDRSRRHPARLGRATRPLYRKPELVASARHRIPPSSASSAGRDAEEPTVATCDM